MLFPYKYIPHSIEKMQKFVDYIFDEVWCKAQSVPDYSFNLYDNEPELKDVIISFDSSNNKSSIFFNTKIREIFDVFKRLPATDIKKLKSWYKANNEIEKLCSNDPDVTPVLYKELKNFNLRLSDLIETFFKNLYPNKDHNILSPPPLSRKIGKIIDHYTEFMNVNKKGKCPFCGINDIKGNNHTKRDAYDHYLPKKLYPFNSINFRNLAPMCNDCNSFYKSAKDPLHSTNDNRRKAFYSYSSACYKVEIRISLTSTDIEHLTSDDITIKFGPPDLLEELNTWNELFEIEKRYKDKCCSADARYWISQVIEEGENCGLMPIKMLSAKFKCAENSPYSDTNFLRIPFLKACKEKNIFKDTL
jgi:hypothetical protein